MSKIIISIIVLALFSATICKNFWECDSAGKHTCPQTQTCCKSAISATKWACFPGQNNTCCSDGISCCPFNTICNLKETKCDAKKLAFLEAPMEGVTLEFADAKLNLGDAKDAAVFAASFLEGFAHFSQLPHEADCKPDDPQIAQDLLEIVNILKNINVHSDFKNVIAQLIEKTTDLISRISKTSAGCKAWGSELQDVLNKLQQHVTASGYATKLALHSASHIGSIASQTKSAIASFQAGNYDVSGRGFGGLLNFVAFWDLKSKL